MQSTSVSEEKLRQAFRAAGQGHVFRGWPEMGRTGQAKLFAQLRAIDLSQLASVIADAKAGRLTPRMEGRAELPAYIALPRTPGKTREREAGRRVGEELIRAGKVAAVTVAGGQATRLQYAGPKGAYPIGPVSGKSLFQIHAERILATRRRCGCAIPWYLMTSPHNDGTTRTFFAEHEYFGLPREDVKFFQQRTMPVLDGDFRIVLAAKDEVMFSPNGTGGCLLALYETGMLDDMEARGVEEISYFNVDNPLVPAADPVFLGFHRRGKAEMSCKAIWKRDPDEPQGALVNVGGRVVVIEYSDLTEEEKRRRTAEGKLLFGLGSPAIHALSVRFVRKEVVKSSTGAATLKLPFHLIQKALPYLDGTGRMVETRTRNVYKFEWFMFDALADAARSAILEVKREEEFSPVKTATGPDSVESARRDMTALYAAWLENAGVQVPRDDAGRPLYPLEISPLYALDASELAARLPRNFRVEGPLYLGPDEAG